MRQGEASMTARHVAAYRQSFPRVERPYGDPEADQRLQADVAGDIQPPATPMARYLRARTAFFDRTVVDAIDGGTVQLVVVGAGYDGRSLRYARPDVRWFELDHPDTQADKLARLADLGIDARHVGFAAADFTADDPAAALRRAGHDPSRPSLYLCEGVAGYLTNGVVAGLLASLRGGAAVGSSFAITVSLEPRPDDAAATRTLLDAAVSRMGEPLASALPRAEVRPFFQASGWTVQRATDPAGVEIGESGRNSAFVVAAAEASPGAG